MRRSRSALVVALAAALIGPGPPRTYADERFHDPGETVMLFAGTDLWHAGGSLLYGGAMWATDGLWTEGFTFKLFAGAGTYRYQAGAQVITAAQTVGSVLPGFTFRRGTFGARVFAGPDLQHHWLVPFDPGNRLSGTHVGLRLAAELWWEPRPDMMVKAAANWSTVGTSYSVSGALGWRLPELLSEPLYIGPELQAAGDGSYRQVRIGAHVTAWRSGLYEWTGTAGFVHAVDVRAGAYFRVGVLARM